MGSGPIDPYQWRRAFHVPFLIGLQITFIVLFGVFVVYDPYSAESPNQTEDDAIAVYPSKNNKSIKRDFLTTFL